MSKPPIVHPAHIEPPNPYDYVVVRDGDRINLAFKCGAELDPALLLLPTRFSAAPDTFFVWIGKVTTSWGEFEIEHDRFLEFLILENGSTHAKWQRANFKRRKEIFSAECDKLFSHRRNIRNYFREILSDAADIHWRRNLIVHGKPSMEISHKHDREGLRPITPIFSTSGVHNGRAVELRFAINDVARLFYRVAHLLGRLDELCRPDPNIPSFSSLDITFLQTFLGKHHAILPHPQHAPIAPLPPLPSQD